MIETLFFIVVFKSNSKISNDSIKPFFEILFEVYKEELIKTIFD